MFIKKGMFAAVEVAAYRIAQEALTNVVRHTWVRHCLVRLELNGALNVEIRDDGAGLPTGGRQNGGLGLLSMRERAVELGSTCVIGPVPGGGTRVLDSLPLPKAQTTNAVIAEQLTITLKTVRNHVSNIYSKLQVADRAQAVIRAREAGLG